MNNHEVTCHLFIGPAASRRVAFYLQEVGHASYRNKLVKAEE